MELIKTRCQQGKLIITEEHIKTTGLTGTQSMLRSSVTGVSYKTVAISLFGLGGAGNLTFSGQGTEQLIATLVNQKVAKQIVEMLGY